MRRFVSFSILGLVFSSEYIFLLEKVVCCAIRLSSLSSMRGGLYIFTLFAVILSNYEQLPFLRCWIGSSGLGRLAYFGGTDSCKVMSSFMISTLWRVYERAYWLRREGLHFWREDYVGSEVLRYRYWVQECSTVQAISSMHFVYAVFSLVVGQKQSYPSR